MPSLISGFVFGEDRFTIDADKRRVLRDDGYRLRAAVGDAAGNSLRPERFPAGADGGNGVVRARRGGDASCEVVSLAFTSGVSQLGVVGSQRRSASVKVVGSKVMRWRVWPARKMCCGWCAWFSFCIVRPDALPALSHREREVTACIRTSYLCSCTVRPGSLYVYAPAPYIYAPVVVLPVVWALPARHWRLSKTLSTPPVRLTFWSRPSRAQANDAVRADFVFLRPGHRLTFVVVLLRLLLAVPVKVDCNETS